MIRLITCGFAPAQIDVSSEDLIKELSPVSGVFPELDNGQFLPAQTEIRFASFF